MVNDFTVRVSDHFPKRSNFEANENETKAFFVFVGQFNEWEIEAHLESEFPGYNTAYTIVESEDDVWFAKEMIAKFWNA